jgi:hypothetical protein
MEINYSKLYYFVRTDIVVVDHNSEMADMSNPDGAIHGDADYIVAETPTGRRFAHDITAITRSNGHTESKVSSLRLEELAFHLNETKPDLDMTHWEEIDPCYGSEAFISQDTEKKNRLREIEEDMDNGEFGAGEAFNMALHVIAPL